MPDLDIIPRAPLPGWRTPSRLIEGSASDGEIAKAIVTSVCESLREGGGLPSLGDFVNVVDGFCSGRLNLLDSMAQSRSIVRNCDGHRHAKIAEQAISQILVAVSQGEAIPASSAAVVAEHFLSTLVDHAVVGRLRPELVGNRYTDYGDAFVHETGFKAVLEPYMTRIAADLVRNPTAQGLRAPSVQLGPLRNTSELLIAPLADLGR